MLRVAWKVNLLQLHSGLQWNFLILRYQRVPLRINAWSLSDQWKSSTSWIRVKIPSLPSPNQVVGLSGGPMGRLLLETPRAETAGRSSLSSGPKSADRKLRIHGFWPLLMHFIDNNYKQFRGQWPEVSVLNKICSRWSMYTTRKELKYSFKCSCRILQ